MMTFDEVRKHVDDVEDCSILAPDPSSSVARTVFHNARKLGDLSCDEYEPVN